jgi:acetyl esterase/lipase
MSRSFAVMITVVASLVSPVCAAEKPLVLDVWPAKAPGEKGDKRSYDAADGIDRLSCRPDFAVLVYPGYLAAGDRLAPEIPVSARTPPTFFVHTGDDPINAENSITMVRALRAAKVPAELHLYATGGHGFGLRPSANPRQAWPRRCAEWMKSRGLLDAAGKD